MTVGKKTIIAAAGAGSSQEQYLITYSGTGNGPKTRLLNDDSTIVMASQTTTPYAFLVGHSLEDGSQLFSTEARSYQMSVGSVAESSSYIVVGGTNQNGEYIRSAVFGKSGSLIKQQAFTFSQTYNNYGGMYALEDNLSSNTLVYAAYNDSVNTGYAAYNTISSSISNIANYQQSAYGAGFQQYRGRNTRLSNGRFIKTENAGFGGSIAEINGTSVSGRKTIGVGGTFGAISQYIGISVDADDSDNIYAAGRYRPVYNSGNYRGQILKLNSSRSKQWHRWIYHGSSGRHVLIDGCDVTATHVVGFGRYYNGSRYEARIWFWEKDGTFDGSKTIRISHSSHNVYLGEAQVLPDGENVLHGIRLYTSSTNQDAVIGVYNLDNPPSGTYAGITFGSENATFTEAAATTYSSGAGGVSKSYSYAGQGTSSVSGPSGTKTTI